MRNLRFLKIHNVQLPKGLIFLSNELRILKWHGYPLKSLPSTFEGKKLVELDMSPSDIELLWKEKRHLDRLKVIKLSHSKKLIRTPDFSDIPNLERLILEGCSSLHQVHPSIGNLQRLRVLNLKDCENLQSLPKKVSGWRSLKVLLLLGCSKIDNLPENLGDCEDLEELSAVKTAITEPCPSIWTLKNLKKLSFGGYKGQTLKRSWFLSFLIGGGPSSKSFLLPSQMAGLSSLTELELSYCNLSAIPSDIGSLSALSKLNLRGNGFDSLPASINKLSRLQILELVDCQMLQTLSELPSSIHSLIACNCSSLKTLIGPLGLSKFETRRFDIQNCYKLLENQGDDEVSLSLLKQHLDLLAKIRIREIFSLFLDFNEKPNWRGPHSARLGNFIHSWMSHLPQKVPGSISSLHVFLPGGSISDWFTYRTTNNSITIELPPYWNNDLTFLGVAVVAAFGVTNHIQKQRTEDVYLDNRISFICSGIFNFSFREPFLDRDMVPLSDHLWLIFLPSRAHYNRDEESHALNGEFCVGNPDFEFKACGFRAVYLQDMELVQTMFQGRDVSGLEEIIQLGRLQLAIGSGSSK